MKSLSLVLIVVTLSGCVPEEKPTQVGLGNPASVYCAKMGGKSVSRETPAGTVSDCHLPDGTIVEEWTLFRANNP